MVPDPRADGGIARARAAVGRFWESLVRPHPSLTDLEQSYTARLLAVLMVAHIVVSVGGLLVVNAVYEAQTGMSIWDDMDAWVVLGGLVVIGAALVALRSGRFRFGVLLYLATTLAVPVMAPFMPDPDAEIGLIATAAIPILLAALAFSERGVIGVLVAVVVLVAVQLAVTPMPPHRTGTGIAILVIIAVTGALLILFRRHFGVLERARRDQLSAADAARLKAELEKQRDHANYRLLFEAVMDGIYIVARDGRVLEVNSAACQQVGYTRDELVGRSLGAISARSREQVQDSLRAVLEQGRACYETLHRRKDGTLVPIELAVNRTEYAGEPAFMGVARDITDRKRAEQERQRLAEQLQHAVKMESIGLLAGGVAHDFNNLLTAIIANIDLMQQDLGPRHALLEPLDEVRHAAESAASLTTQLLAFSRKRILEPRLVDVNQLVQHMRKLLTRLIGEDIELRTVCAASPPLVTVDPSLLEQVVVNLCVNARDAMPHGGRLVIETGNVELDANCRETHPETQPGRYVTLAVADTGVGMSEEVRQHLFEPFFTTKPKGRGTGLGLATAYGVIQQSNGQIEVYSELGKGTAFKIYLPRSEGKLTSAAPRQQHVTAGHETVLVVEDEAVLRRLACRILKRSGYRVLVASSGDEALTLAGGHPGRVDLLLTDVVMPGMSGTELSGRLQARYPAIRVLYTSGYTEDTIVRRGVLEGEFCFIAKPYTPQTLLGKVREALDTGAPTNAARWTSPPSAQQPAK
ncbi:MAG: PAS domain S-box protein [Polyangiaceae bacterium]|nr:PAS domain S-box protein [Polyangiaceae bacterium]